MNLSLSVINATEFSNVLKYIADLFKEIILKLDSFKLVGSLSIFDFIIMVAVIDIIISAFFVTFRAGQWAHDRAVEEAPAERVPSPKERANIEHTEDQVRRLQYW